MGAKECIEEGKAYLGIEFGSTRIKGVVCDEAGEVLAIGGFGWENSLKDGIWTYSMEEVTEGIQDCYAKLVKDIKDKYGVAKVTKYGAIGISAMMHGIIALDKDGKLLSPFQTWRNSNTQAAADKLTELFDFNIPLRWTISHLYQFILDNEPFVKDIDFCTTLDSYATWKITGEKNAGVGDASGIFPIDSSVNDYDQTMVDKFDDLIKDKGYPWKVKDILPKVLVAGEKAGTLTEEGAKWIDPTGDLEAGIPIAPSEGDAGTGMVATNAVGPRTGNVSAGTSTFAMLVMEKPLSQVYREIDMVTTPTGLPVAMSHANNGTTHINAWVNIFKEFAEKAGTPVDEGKIFETLFNASMEGDKDCDGIMSYGYYSGEGVTHLNEGRPVLAYMPDSKFSLANFMRAHLYTSLAAVTIGMDILIDKENVAIDRITGHGGLFTQKGVCQSYLAAALNAPVTCMDTASEGGPWGMAILAAFLVNGNGRKLEDYLDQEVFANLTGSTIDPDKADDEGFAKFIENYKKGIEVEKAAIGSMDFK